jgi:hydrogenase maturation protease
MKALIAGVGNIFLTDDGFGPAVLEQVAGRTWPAGVTATDFGIRGVHLAYELLDGYDVLVVVDAAPRGLAAGTVSLIEVDPATADEPTDGPLLDAHGMEPVAVLRSLSSLGGSVSRVFVVACEPVDTGEGMGLTDAVAAAIPAAVSMLEQLISDLTGRSIGPSSAACTHAATREV